MIVAKTFKMGQTLQYTGRPLLGMLAWDVLIVVAYKVLHWEWVGSNSVPLALYGAAITIIVGFRNNYAYARWWEARNIWGQIVNRSRTLARQVTTMSPLPESGVDEGIEVMAMQRKIVHYQIAFVHALRQQLRGLDPVGEIRELLPLEKSSELSKEKNVSLALQLKIGEMVQEARCRRWINDWEWQAIDQSLVALMDSQGSAERIKNTPLPKQYDFSAKIFVLVYCLMLPIGMVESMGWFTPLGSTVVGFMFLVLDKIGRDLEDPFDNKVYDIALTSITKTIEINLRQLLGETTLPAPETPVQDVLW